ncbi:MAG: hypothetical protein H8D23_11400 [Candidatus Brocadiales bacterium]|nr:hypothetical protein [Candidatus Brocadiales bacterium]
MDIKEYSFTLPAHLYGTHCGELIKTFFKSDSALSSKAVIRNISNSVDKNTYNEIMNVVSDVSSKIYNLSKKGPGGIPFAFVGMVDTMEFSIVGEENE